MRVLMVSQAVPFLPCYDGFRIIPAHLLRELSKAHEIHLLAFSDGSESPEQLAWAAQHSASVEVIEPGPSRGGLFQKLARQVRRKPSATSITVRSKIQTLQPDLVHLEGPNTACLTAGLSSIPCILSAHDCLWLRYRQFVPFARSFREACSYRLRAWRGRRLERRWYKHLDHIVVTSPADREALSRWIPAERITVIPNGVDLRPNGPPVQENPARIIFTGNMSWPPNEDAAEYFANQCLPLIRLQFPAAEYWVVGASPSSRVRRLASLPGVTVTGTVPDLAAYVLQSTLYASPLRFGAGVKNKILEAMALGVPIVATPPSLTGTPVVHERHLLIADTAPAIAESVIRLLSDTRLRQTLSDNGRALITEHYSWAAIASRFLEVWRAHARQPIKAA